MERSSSSGRARTGLGHPSVSHAADAAPSAISDFVMVFRRKRGIGFDLRGEAGNLQNGDFLQENACFQEIRESENAEFK